MSLIPGTYPWKSFVARNERAKGISILHGCFGQSLKSGCKKGLTKPKVVSGCALPPLYSASIAASFIG